MAGRLLILQKMIKSLFIFEFMAKNKFLPCKAAEGEPYGTQKKYAL